MNISYHILAILSVDIAILIHIDSLIIDDRFVSMKYTSIISLHVFGMKQNSFTFVDIETTGSRVNYDRIIEVGLLRVENDEIVSQYQTLINPETYVSPFIEEMTGIHQEDLLTAPTFEDVKEKIYETIYDSVFVAHNVRFDYGFLINEFKRYGISFSSKMLCTVKLSRHLFPEHRRHNLDSIIERHNIVCQNRHRAFDDAKVLWEFFGDIKRRFTTDVLEKAIDVVMKRPSLPTAIGSDILDKLPESPGVYIFYGENKIPLYVGKSINIRERVLSHFAGDHTSSKEMNISQQIQSIETISTAGELGALIKEAHLVKSMQPLYNRQLRYAHKMIVIKLLVDTKGFMVPHLEMVDQILPDDITAIVNVFKSKTQAQQFLEARHEEFGLCKKMLGLEKSSNSCFGFKLGKCQGACVGKESTQSYNLRMQKAMEKAHILPWKYSGPIVVTEQNPLNELAESFVIDKWCYLGSYHSDGYVSDTKLESDVVFDHDTYKILKRYLSDISHRTRIKKITYEQLQQMNQEVTYSYS